MNHSMRVSFAVAIGVAAVVVVACSDKSQPPKPKTASAKGAIYADAGIPPRMRSLQLNDRVAESEPESPRIDAAPVVNGNRDPSGPRSTPARIGVRRDSGGNTQIFNAEGIDAAAVSQRQTGAGNYQSMNIGVTDNPSVPIAGGSSRP